MRSILLYLLGVPIPLILLIALFTHHCWSDDVIQACALRPGSGSPGLVWPKTLITKR